MMSTFVTRAWQTVKPHVPLIKFRKGGMSRVPESPSVAAAAAAPAATEGAKGGAPKLQTKKLPAIEDWQLPPRFRRTNLDEKEIDMINSGGAY